jgi:hypothetical protein
VSLEVATNDDGWGTAESSPATICPPDVSLILSIVTVLSGEEKVVLAYPIRSWMPNGTYRARVSVYLPRDGSSRTVTSPTFGLVAPEP